MPLVQLEHLPADIYWGIWDITESKQELEVLCDHQYPNLKGTENRINQSLAARITAFKLCEKAFGNGLWLDKGIGDKPFFPKNKTTFVSISHSGTLASAAIAPFPIGIDIQKQEEKIRNVAPRVFTDEELFQANDSLLSLTRLWTGKEAVFKLKGGDTTFYQSNIHIDLASLQAPKATAFTGEENIYECKLYYTTRENYCMAITWDKTPTLQS